MPGAGAKPWRAFLSAVAGPVVTRSIASATAPGTTAWAACSRVEQGRTLMRLPPATPTRRSRTTSPTSTASRTTTTARRADRQQCRQPRHAHRHRTTRACCTWTASTNPTCNDWTIEGGSAGKAPCRPLLAAMLPAEHVLGRHGRPAAAPAALRPLDVGARRRRLRARHQPDGDGRPACAASTPSAPAAGTAASTASRSRHDVWLVPRGLAQ